VYHTNKIVITTVVSSRRSTYILRKIPMKWYHYCNHFEHIGSSISRFKDQARQRRIILRFVPVK